VATLRYRSAIEAGKQIENATRKIYYAAEERSERWSPGLEFAVTNGGKEGS